jgi:hypothetical protein
MVIAIIGAVASVVLVVLFGFGWYAMVTNWPERAFGKLYDRMETLLKEIKEVYETAAKPCECGQYKCQPCKARLVIQWWAQRDKEEVELKQIPWWKRPQPKFAKPPWEAT